MSNAELKTAMLLHKGAAAHIMPPHCSAALKLASTLLVGQWCSLQAQCAQCAVVQCALEVQWSMLCSGAGKFRIQTMNSINIMTPTK